MTGTIRMLDVSDWALIRDRSNSKSGMDKSMRKSGGGAHNWGNIEDQIEGEMYDDGEEETVNDARKAASDASSSPVQANDRRLSVSTASTGTSSNLTEEKEKAVEYRAKALRGGDLDLAAIARTSGGIATSPPK